MKLFTKILNLDIFPVAMSSRGSSNSQSGKMRVRYRASAKKVENHFKPNSDGHDPLLLLPIVNARISEQQFLRAVGGERMSAKRRATLEALNKFAQTSAQSDLEGRFTNHNGEAWRDLDQAAIDEINRRHDNRT